MSDLIKFTPSATAGLCNAGTQYIADVCRSDNGGMTQAPDAVGAPSACNGTDAAPMADAVYLYLTTNPSAGSGGNTFMQPTGAGSTNGLNLTSPLVIAGIAEVEIRRQRHRQGRRRRGQLRHVPAGVRLPEAALTRPGCCRGSERRCNGCSAGSRIVPLALVAHLA